jgi:hypothetical protein
MKYIEMKNKNGKSLKALGILTGAKFDLKKHNKKMRLIKEPK